MHLEGREHACVCFDQRIRRLGRSLARDQMKNVQPAKSIREPSRHGSDVRSTLPNVISINTEFHVWRVRVWCIRDEGASWRWELLALAVNETKALKTVASNHDIGNSV